jgi:hypothetical protein
LFRQRLYQIIAGYEDANDADRLRYARCNKYSARSTAARHASTMKATEETVRAQHRFLRGVFGISAAAQEASGLD